MRHPSIKAGCVATGLASGSLPLDPRLVVDNPHVTPVVVGAHVRLILHDHNGPLEEILAAREMFFISQVSQSESTHPSQE